MLSQSERNPGGGDLTSAPDGGGWSVTKEIGGLWNNCCHRIHRFSNNEKFSGTKMSLI